MFESCDLGLGNCDLSRENFTYFTLLYFNHFLKNIHIVRSRGEDQKQEQIPLQMVTQKKKKIRSKI